MLRRLVLDREVKLIPGQQIRDHYQRALVHIRLTGSTNPHKLLLRAGYCSTIAIPPNLRFLEDYRVAKKSARETRRGIWGHAYFQPRPAHRLSTKDQGYRFIVGRIQRIGESK